LSNILSKLANIYLKAYIKVINFVYLNMDTERQENNTILGVVVVVLVVLLVGLLTYLIFFLPKNGDELATGTEGNVEQEEDVVDEDIVVEEDDEEEEEDPDVEDDEEEEASDLEESEVQATYMGEYPGAPALAYFKASDGKEYLMDTISYLTAEDVDTDFVLKIESEEEISEGTKVEASVWYFRVVTYKGDGGDVSEDYDDYIYFEKELESGKEVYFLKDYGLSITVDNEYEFLFTTLEELEGAAGTTYYKMRGSFEYSTH
jgi:hypothetical protein